MDNNFADRIKKLRKKMKMTQKEFAKEFYVDPVTIRRWEKGQRRPHLVHLRQLERLERK